MKAYGGVEVYLHATKKCFNTSNTDINNCGAFIVNNFLLFSEQTRFHFLRPLNKMDYSDKFSAYVSSEIKFTHIDIQGK
jgi:hypothetical protein